MISPMDLRERHLFCASSKSTRLNECNDISYYSNCVAPYAKTSEEAIENLLGPRDHSRYDTPLHRTSSPSQSTLSATGTPSQLEGLTTLQNPPIAAPTATPVSKPA